MEIQGIVQEAGIKTIPKKKKCKKAKWLSEKDLQIAEKRRKAKSKGEKERYTHLNAEFQRIARRDKKAFLTNQCKEIEENNRMGKTRDLFKKIRDIKGTFHGKMGLIGKPPILNFPLNWELSTLTGVQITTTLKNKAPSSIPSKLIPTFD